MLQSVIKLSHEKFPKKTLHFTGQETYFNYYFFNFSSVLMVIMRMSININSSGSVLALHV